MRDRVHAAMMRTMMMHCALLELEVVGGENEKIWILPLMIKK